MSAFTCLLIWSFESLAQKFQISGSRVRAINSEAVLVCNNLNSQTKGIIKQKGQYRDYVEFTSGKCAGLKGWVLKQKMRLIGSSTQQVVSSQVSQKPRFKINRLAAKGITSNHQVVCKMFFSGSKGVVLRYGEKGHFNWVQFTSGPCVGQKAWVSTASMDVTHGASPVVKDHGTEAGVAVPGCATGDCRSRNIPLAIDGLGEVAGAKGYQSIPQRHLYGQGECYKFVNENGDLGDYGSRVLKALDAVDTSRKCFHGNGIRFGSQVCQNYPSFTAAQKRRFWVYVFQSMAFKESTCRHWKKGDKGTSDGLFQMEYDNGLRGDNNRPAPFCKPYESHNTQELKFQFECTAAILKQINCSEGKGWGPLGQGGKGSVFWTNFRNAPGKVNSGISTLVARYPGCQ